MIELLEAAQIDPTTAIIVLIVAVAWWIRSNGARQSAAAERERADAETQRMITQNMTEMQNKINRELVASRKAGELKDTQLNTLQDALTDARIDVAKLSGEVDKFRELMDAKDQNFKLMQRVNQQLDAQIEQLKDDIKIIKHDWTQLKENLQTERFLRVEAEKERDQLKEQYLALQETHKAATNKLSDEIIDLTKEMNKLKERIEKHEKPNNDNPAIPVVEPTSSSTGDSHTRTDSNRSNDATSTERDTGSGGITAA